MFQRQNQSEYKIYPYRTHPIASHEEELQNRQVPKHRFFGSDSHFISTQYGINFFHLTAYGFPEKKIKTQHFRLGAVLVTSWVFAVLENFAVYWMVVFNLELVSCLTEHFSLF